MNPAKYIIEAEKAERAAHANSEFISRMKKSTTFQRRYLNRKLLFLLLLMPVNLIICLQNVHCN